METLKIIKTPRGTFNVKAIFLSVAEANENGFHEYFTNTDGIRIFTKHISEYSVYFATLETESAQALAKV